MKQQEIFNHASYHLMNMEGPSLDQDGDACVYRGKDEGGEFNGQKCVIGLFMEDEHYDEDLEGQSIDNSPAVVYAVAQSWGCTGLSNKQLRLLYDLQIAHDHRFNNCENWSAKVASALKRIARKHQLEFNA